MSTPTYDPSLTPVKNTQAALDARSIENVGQTFETSAAQLLNKHDALLRDGAFETLTNSGTTIINGAQALSGAGAVNVTTTVTKFTSTDAAQALTLANGTDGQIKTIIHVVDGGSGVLTPTTKTGFTTVTFTNAGDSVTLQYNTTIGWVVIASFGVTIA